MLSLVADYNTSSSSSSCEEADTETDEEQQQNTEKNKEQPPPPPVKGHSLLPSANTLLRSGSSKTAGEVFCNPFLEAEKLEIDKLQQHVRMVDSENHILQKNGRKICWNNRKGRCRFGNKCKYAHDSDLVETAYSEEPEKQIRNSKEQKLPNELTTISKPPAAFVETHDLDFSNESSSEKMKNRKRPGLGDSIVPGKRVMKTYHHTKKTTS